MSDDTTQRIDPAAVFESLEAAHRDGTLREGVTTGWPRYQASASRPGRIERIDESGSVTVGTWRDGRFVADYT